MRQERMGHWDLSTTKGHADYAPSMRGAELIAAAFTVDARATRPAALSRAL